MHVNLTPFLEKNTSLFMKVGAYNADCCSHVHV
jgi:hypothetical protein